MIDPSKPDDAMLTRLLGVAEDELTCEQCFELLDVYVDSEFADEDPDKKVPGMRAHLAGCPACDEDHRSLRALVESER